MNYEALQIRIEPPVATIELCRPERGNAVDSRLVTELRDVAETLREIEEVRVVVLTAQGTDFCVGWDDSEAGAGATDAFGSITGLPQPVVAAVQGRCVSAGLELALACDVRIAATDAVFALPETERGVLPSAGGSQRLPRLIGRGRALAMLLTGEELHAAGALRAGLVTKVVESGALADEASRLAATMASRGPIALKYAKEAVYRGMEMTLEQALRYETDLTVILQTTEDRAEGVKAFLEKRPPDFKGK